MLWTNCWCATGINTENIDKQKHPLECLKFSFLILLRPRWPTISHLSEPCFSRVFPTGHGFSSALRFRQHIAFYTDWASTTAHWPLFCVTWITSIEISIFSSVGLDLENQIGSLCLSVNPHKVPESGLRSVGVATTFCNLRHWLECWLECEVHYIPVLLVPPEHRSGMAGRVPEYGDAIYTRAPISQCAWRAVVLGIRFILFTLCAEIRKSKSRYWLVNCIFGTHHGNIWANSLWLGLCLIK